MKKSGKTLRQWSELGWRVKAGSKSKFRIDGVCAFTRDQVERPEWHKPNCPKAEIGPNYFSTQRRGGWDAQGWAVEQAEIYGDDAYMFGADF